MSTDLLTILTAVPLIGAVVLACLSRQSKPVAQAVALGFNLVSLVLAALLWKNFDTSSAEIQFSKTYEWIPSIGAQYYVGIDGLGLLMVLLSAIIVPFELLASWKIDD